MIRVLSMIALAGFFLSIVCITAAIGLAGPDAILSGAWNWSDHGKWVERRADWNTDWDDHKTAEATREVAWTGGDTLSIELPADVRFTQAEGPAKLVLKGDRRDLDHVEVEDGHVRFDRPAYGSSQIDIEMTAPHVTRFVLAGSGVLDIAGYRQDSLAVQLSGNGDVTAHGAARTVDLAITGSGDADLAGLAADGAQVRISGAGQAKVAPKTWAKLDISGSGDVSLLSRPKQLESHVSGSGRIEQQGAS